MWKVKVDKRVTKDLRKVPQQITQRVKSKILVIAEDPTRYSHYALQDDRLMGMFRLRISDWRVFYSLDYSDQEIIILAVKHRKDAYK